MKEHIGRREYSEEVKKYGPKETAVKKYNNPNDAPEVEKEDPVQPNKDLNADLTKDDKNILENAFKTSQNLNGNMPVKGKMYIPN